MNPLFVLIVLLFSSEAMGINCFSPVWQWEWSWDMESALFAGSSILLHTQVVVIIMIIVVVIMMIMIMIMIMIVVVIIMFYSSAITGHFHHNWNSSILRNHNNYRHHRQHNQLCFQWFPSFFWVLASTTFSSSHKHSTQWVGSCFVLWEYDDVDD